MTPSTAMERYLHALTELQGRMLESQLSVLAMLAARMADATRRDQRLFLFGTGHSHILAEEGFFRAGGLANVVPLLAEHLMLHSLPGLGPRLERTPGLADLILERYEPQPGEMLFVFSNSGVNRLPLEMALRGRERGLFVVGVSSFEYARLAPSSTVIGALLWNALVAETAQLLLEAGITPPVFASLNVPDAAEHNQALLDKWRPRNIHL